MKIRLAIAALLLAGTGAFAASRYAFAQSSSTGNNFNTVSNCQPLDAEVGGVTTTSSSSAPAVPVTGSTPAPAATAAPSTTTAPSTGTATPAPTATTSTSGTGGTTNTGSTGSTSGTTGSETKEQSFCLNGVHMDIGAASGTTIFVTSAKLSTLETGTSGAAPVQATGSNGTTQGNNGSNGQGAVPVTGANNSTPIVNNIYGFNAFDPTALSGGQAFTVSLGNGQSAAHMEICASNASAIYMWMTSSMWSTYYKVNGAQARWMRIPSFTNVKGQTCVQSWLPGTYVAK